MGSDSQHEPDWSRLPQDPVGFFQLPDNFERKMLKRKYNQYIRQYKPEKFPAEFQKIRAAYELLDGQLRYGTSTARRQETTYQWKGQEVAESPSASTAESQQPQIAQQSEPQEIVVPVHQRLQTESAQSIFDEYKKSTGKSPYDYFAMALLSDVACDDPLMFFKLILTGLKKHPNEQGLMSLLYEYLKQDFVPQQIPGVLKTVSKVVTNQYFYFLTEKLWEQYLRFANFDSWAQTLESCEANLVDFRIEGQIAFYLHILPAAIFKAKPKWLQEKFEFLRSAGTEIPHELEMDFELVHQLYDYRKSIARDNLYSQQIHRALADYFCLSGRKGDEAVIALQTYYAQNPGLLLEAYGPEQEYSDLQLGIWDYINEEVCQRHALSTTMDPRRLRAKIFDLMDDLNRSEFASFGWKEEFQYRWMHYGTYAVALASPFLLLMGWFNHAVVVYVAFVLAGTAAFLVWFAYRPAERYEQYIEKRMRRRYFAEWRGRFVHLFEATQMHHYEVSEALIEIVEHHSDKVQFASWLCHYLPADVGLHLFASASRYMQ